MERIGNVRILFIAGFGPIVRDTVESRKLYSESLSKVLKRMVGPWRLELQTSTVSKRRHYVLPTT
jgi:hypothetical protein